MILVNISEGGETGSAERTPRGGYRVEKTQEWDMQDKRFPISRYTVVTAMGHDKPVQGSGVHHRSFPGGILNMQLVDFKIWLDCLQGFYQNKIGICKGVVT